MANTQNCCCSYAVIDTDRAPRALGAYVQAVDLGSLVITSGQLGIDPQTGVLENDVAKQTTQALENVRALVEKAGIGVQGIVKTTLFIQNMDDFTLINAEYEKFFVNYHHPAFPARSMVEVAKLPKGALIEIEAIAIRQ